MKIKRLNLALALALLMSFTTIAQSQGIERTRARFINAIPGMTALQLRLERNGMFPRIKYQFGTPYRMIFAGDQLLDITTLAGKTTVIPPFDWFFETGIDYTVVAMGSISGEPPIDAIIFEWERQRVPLNEVYIAFINAVPDSDFADLYIDGNYEASAFFPDSADFPIISRGSHTVEVDTGNSFVSLSRRLLTGGRIYTIVVFGTEDPDDNLPVGVRFFVSN